jgi:putative ABC transport system ATP-binding protein
MERLGIRHLAGQKPARLSFGERQRAAVCRALITGPELVLADEPTANLDPESAARTLELLLENSRTTGSSLFLISHDKGHAGLVDRVLRMESLAQGAPA